MPLVNTTREGTLTISGISLNPANGAWGVFGDERGEGGLVHLWTKFDVRGEDRLLPGATGVLAYPRRMTVTRCDLRFLVAGDMIGQTSTPATDSIQGLATNLEYLRANILAPVVSATGTRAAVLTVPGQSNRSASVHVLGMVIQSYALSLGCDGSIAITTLQLSIPGGRFA
jgi:hypothetical protein